jgi:transposase
MECSPVRGQYNFFIRSASTKKLISLDYTRDSVSSTLTEKKNVLARKIKKKIERLFQEGKIGMAKF